MAFKGGGRPNQYLNTGGDKLPSVTTILGRFKDSGPLLHWAFGQGKAAERGEIRRLYDKRDEAAEIGTVAHDMAEAHIHKIDPMACLRDSGLVEDHAHTALQAFEMFERWEQIANVEWTHTEVPVVSERLQVGGTIDAVANVAGSSVSSISRLPRAFTATTSSKWLPTPRCGRRCSTNRYRRSTSSVSARTGLTLSTSSDLIGEMN